MPQVNDPQRITPLLTALRACSPEERDLFAELAKTTTGYLYTVAGLGREPKVRRALAIAEASKKMHEKNPAIPIVSVEQIADAFKGEAA